jgi:hypothetical protein
MRGITAAWSAIRNGSISLPISIVAERDIAAAGSQPPGRSGTGGIFLVSLPRDDRRRTRANATPIVMNRRRGSVS